MNLTGWSKSLEVTGDGDGIVSHAGLALLRQLTDKTGLTGGLSRALASPRLLIHDRGRVTADLACAIADGHEVIGVDVNPEKVTIRVGELFFTPPMVDHAMVFTQDTVFLTLGRNSREQAAYEADVVRIPPIVP